jgi:hypothetical protein
MLDHDKLKFIDLPIRYGGTALTGPVRVQKRQLLLTFKTTAIGGF